MGVGWVATKKAMMKIEIGEDEHALVAVAFCVHRCRNQRVSVLNAMVSSRVFL